MAKAAGDLGRALGAPIRGERPGYRLLDKAVLEGGAGVVEDEGIALAGEGTQHAAHHLSKKAHASRRPRDDDAGRRRAVPALGQNRAIGDDIDFPGSEQG